jgi:two-component system response regulator NreC
MVVLRLASSGAENAVAGEGLPVRVALAEGHRLVRRSLRLVLEREGGIEVIAEPSDLASVLRTVKANRPHVLVLDLSMPDGSSMRAICDLRERVPDTQIVVLSMDDSPVVASRALSAGAVGYILKELADSELADAIRAAARPGEYIGRRVGVAQGAPKRSPAKAARAV